MDQVEHLLAVFREEAAETTDELAQRIESLRSHRGEESAEAVADAARAAHNLKGAALSVGHEELGELCHAFEDALGPLHELQAPPDEALLDSLLDSITTMQRLAAECPLPEVLAERCGASEAVDAGADGGESEVRIKVNARRLDRLMSHTGELLVSHAGMIARNQRLKALRQEVRDLAAEGEPSRQDLDALDRRFETLLRSERRELLDFGHLAQEMSEAMKRVRMMPLKGLAPSWRRVVRESAQELGKRVDLTVKVGELELDKFLLDNLRDPLVHLLRNAVDHGIESAEERDAQGKPKHGRIRIRAEMVGSRVRLEVSDDGRGLDPGKIAEFAVRQGLIDEQQRARLDDGEILSLLFRTGFSTATAVTQISGRGVGLDVVREQVEKVGGTVHLPAVPALGGTSFELRVPISLLSISGLLVRARHEVYAIPIDYIDRTLRVDREAVRRVDGAPVVMMDSSEPLRIHWLVTLMGERSPEVPEQLTVLVVSRGTRHLGLVVDEVIGERELVTKPLPWNLEKVPGLSGATILADGSVALSLDVSAIFDAAVECSEPVLRPAAPAPGRAPARILVADDSLASRTLERNMLAAAGYDVSVCVNGEEAWDRLQRERFDLLVSDIRMPRLDGFELTRRIRASDAIEHLPVVLVTGLDEPEDIARGAEVGADEYIIKGELDQGRLLEAVSRLL
ncbi:MAG: response regulator [bacterium]|nr:response regulator [bacterium]